MLALKVVDHQLRPIAGAKVAVGGSESARTNRRGEASIEVDLRGRNGALLTLRVRHRTAGALIERQVPFAADDTRWYRVELGGKQVKRWFAGVPRSKLASRPHRRPARGARASAAGAMCSGHSSLTTPPGQIRVARRYNNTSNPGAIYRVDTIDFNRYVRGVLASEWIISWPMESLKAGALAVKNYGWARSVIYGPGSWNGQCFDVDDSTNYQVYKDTFAGSTDAAIASTWGTWVRKNNQAFLTFYLAGTPGMACGAGNDGGIRMRQWGTKTCADQGKGYRDIVDDYYFPVTFFSNPVRPISDLFAIRLNGANGRTELHRLSAFYAFKGFSLHTTTALHTTSIDKWQFDVGEFDRDGKPDLYAINMKGGSGKTEVHILSGASNYQSFTLHSTTALHQTNRENWRFVVGDLDLDGRDDVYAISMKGGSGSTEVHVLSASSNFTAFSLHTPTPLHQTNRANWQFDAGDWEGDGRDDLYAIGMKGGSNSTEVHILNAAAYGFRAFSLHTPTPLHQTNEAGWQFVAGNLDGDARTDVYAVAHRGGSGMTEAHVLNAAAYGFRAFSLHSATALHPTNLFEWQFAAAP